MSWSWSCEFCLGIYSHSYKGRLSQNDLDRFTKSDDILDKYLSTINHEDFYADEQTNMFASHDTILELLVYLVQQSQSSQSSTITHYVCPAEFCMHCTTGLEIPSCHHH